MNIQKVGHEYDAQGYWELQAKAREIHVIGSRFNYQRITYLISVWF